MDYQDRTWGLNSRVEKPPHKSIHHVTDRHLFVLSEGNKQNGSHDAVTSSDRRCLLGKLTVTLISGSPPIPLFILLI